MRELSFGGPPAGYTGYQALTVRPTAEDINSAPSVASSGQRISGDGAVIPIIYGRYPTQGLLVAEVEYSGYLYSVVIWCLGEVYSITPFINDEAPVSGVEVRNYRGTTTQGVDSWMSTAISGYTDTYVITDRGESIGCAYSVFRMPTSTYSGPPQYKAIIEGKLINDPNAAANTDPYFSQNGIDVDFTSGGTDQSDNAHTITLAGSASIDSGGLQLGATSPLAYATVSDHSSLEAGGSQLTFEIVATSDSIAAGVSTLVRHSDEGSPLSRSFQIDRDTDSLLLYLSSDGVTWDIANGVDIGTITTAKFYSTIERIGSEYIAYLDGSETARISSASSVFNSTADWYLGTPEYPWEGSVQGWRYLIGNIRYGAEHAATAEPFADSDTYGAQTVYSTNPALMWADMASSDLYGLGATTDGVAYAANYCLELLDASCGSPQPQRCETGILISSNREVTYWLDLLAMYANCIWYPWGSDLRIQPDERVTAENPSGQNILLDYDFDDDANWTLGTGWAIAAGVATVDGTQTGDSLLSQTLVTEADTEYGLSITISAISAGTISVDFNGAEVISAQSVAGTYAILVTPTTTSTDIDIRADSDAVATISTAYVKRSYWLETEWIAGSLSVVGPSESGTPTSVKANYSIPASDTPNWATASTVKTSPLAENGTLPFIQTTLDLPGVFKEGEANNKAVQRVQRMHNRFNVFYTTTDHGIIQRIGDAVQPVNAYRGIDDPVWVESVEMVDYGRYRVTGSKYSNLHFPDYCEIDLCNLELPTSGTIVAESIWDESTDVVPYGTGPGNRGTMGVYENIIIANPGGDRIIYSDDMGDTWTETGSLPASYASPGDPTKWLNPTSWQYVNGVWYCHLRENQETPGNETAYIGSTVDGSSWTIGSAIYNGKYSIGSGYITTDGELVFAGRRPDTNHLIWSKYSTEYGSTSLAGTWVDGPNNSNVYALFPVSGAYMSITLTSSLDIYEINSSISTATYNAATNLTGASSIATNYIDTVLINQGGTEFLQWKAGLSSGAIPTVSLPVTNADVAVGWNSDYWLAAATVHSGATSWEMAHSEDQDGATFTAGPSLSLPSTQISAYYYSGLHTILPATSTWWIGFYIADDGYMEIIRFKYGTSEC